MHRLFAIAALSSLSATIALPAQYPRSSLPDTTDLGSKGTCDLENAFRRFVVGTTWRDYQWIGGGPRRLVFHNGRSVMTYLQQTWPSAPIEMVCVDYNGVTFSLPIPIVPALSSSYGSSVVDIWRDGPKEGYVSYIVSAIPPNTYYVYEDSTGRGGVPFWQVFSDVSVLHIDAQRGVVLEQDSKNRTDYHIARSTDFGATWAEANPGVFATTILPGGQTMLTIDPYLGVAPNGTVILGCSINGYGDITPIGTASPDSASQLGYFTSTDQGSTWKWNTIAPDGVQYDNNHFALFTNFGQQDYVVGLDNTVHGVWNGFNFYRFSSSPADSFRLSIDVVYWNSVYGFRSLVSFDRTLPILEEVINHRGGNCIGCSYPSIAISPDGEVIVCTWSQPNFTATTIDTNSSGVITSNIWYNVSFNGGATWFGAQKLDTAAGALEVFGTMAENLEVYGGTAYRARILYLLDAHGSSGDLAGAEKMIYQEFVIGGCSVNEKERRPTGFMLEQCYPNPFNPGTTIRYRLPASTFVTVEIFDLLGRIVQTLVNQEQTPGMYTVLFDGSQRASGMYICRMSAGSFHESKKILLIR